MLSRRMRRVAIVSVALLGPFTAIAHAESSGAVTTGPVITPAPAIGMPLMALLAVLLAVGGAYLLWYRRGAAVAKVGVVAALTVLVGFAYATNGGPQDFTIHDAQCGMVVVTTFNPIYANTLTSGCPNPIKILTLTFDCVDPPPPNRCYEGQVLTTGQSCDLPVCVG